MAAGYGRRPPEHRKAPGGTGGRCGQAPAHRPCPQRPGRYRHPPVAARRNRQPAGPAAPAAPRAGCGRSGQRRHHHAGLHSPASRPARHVRPSPAGLR
ncbi:hypothetical protein G6F40_017978 [Rhizopus arrhizus]|nr:hypothetical protein G6F40_017978 [Rhizopus arrhizus]